MSSRLAWVTLAYSTPASHGLVCERDDPSSADVDHMDLCLVGICLLRRSITTLDFYGSKTYLTLCWLASSFCIYPFYYKVIRYCATLAGWNTAVLSSQSIIVSLEDTMTFNKHLRGAAERSRTALFVLC